MPPTTTPTDPVEPQPQTGDLAAPDRVAATDSDAPVSFIPHTDAGAVGNAPVKIKTARYGEVDAHELIRLLDTIEDERAKGRFRESIYISLFVWLAIAWFVFYGPSVLWHAPRLKLPGDAIKEHELTRLTVPLDIAHFKPTPDSGTPNKAPTPTHELPHKAMDAKTLSAIKAMAAPSPKAEAPPPPSAAPPPVAVAPPTTAPSAITHTETRAPMPSTIPDAPKPQVSSLDSLKLGSNNPSTSMENLAHTPRNGGGGNPGGMATLPGRGKEDVGVGPEILSDTQGVDFTAWMRRTTRGTLSAWGPLLPEEIQPPISKKGMTTLVITIAADGTVTDMKIEGSTHDDALNRAAWGSIISQGKLTELPKEFHGKEIVLRFRYYVNMDR